MTSDKKYHIKRTSKETLANWFYLMNLGRNIDNKAPNYLKQAIGWSYHAPYAGHDGIQLAIGKFLIARKIIYSHTIAIC
jgi:2-oxoisovalerate dehydrogenase E1 component